MVKLSNFIFLFVIFAFCVVKNFANNCTCVNTKEFILVCGSDGRTYTNPEQIECYNKCNNAHVKLVKRKPCDCKCPINRMFSPVCGSNGKSYVNPSAVRCHNRCNYPSIEIVKKTACKKGDELLRQ